MNVSQPLRERLGWGTVRSRVTAIIIAVTSLSMVVVGALVTAIQYNDAIDTAYKRLDHSENEVRQFAERTTSAQGADYPDTSAEFVVAFLRQQFPFDNEGMAGFVDQKLSYHQGGAGYPIHTDDELIDIVAPLTTSTTTLWRDVSTSTNRFIILVVPVAVGDSPPAAIVFAHSIDDEIAPVWEFVRTFIMVSIVTVLLAGLAAWLITGRVMEPLANLRRLTTEISEHNLSERLPIDDQSDDLVEVSRSFNSMVDRMEAAFASQYQLLDDAGHELRTPVTIVQGHLDVMNPDDPGDVRETRDLALAELDRMKRLTNDLVLLAKTERPDFLNVEPVDIADLTSDVFAHVRQLGEREWILGPVARIVADVDPQRLTQAWIQLAANAVKFSDPGTSITISSAVRRAQSPGTVSGNVLALSVADQGRGIDEGDLERIFDRFGRVDSAVQGAGLGLSIVRGIAQAHGGEVEVISTLGEGSTFSLLLPIPPTTAITTAE